VTAGDRAERTDPEADRRLLALAAVFTPHRASALLSRLEPAESARMSTEAAAAATSRRARLEALALHVPGGTGRETGARFERLAALERATTAAALRTAVCGTASRGLTPALLRLIRERTG
jgi:hypothetical protein